MKQKLNLLLIATIIISTILIGKFVLQTEAISGDYHIGGGGWAIEIAKNYVATGELSEFTCRNPEFEVNRTKYYAYRSPLFPVITAMGFKLGWLSVQKIGRFVIVQAGLQILLGLVLFLIYMQFFQSFFGAYVVLLTTYFFQGYFDIYTQFRPETLYMFLWFTGILVCFKFWSAPRTKICYQGLFLGGILIGLSILCKPSYFYLLPIFTIAGALGLVIFKKHNNLFKKNLFLCGIIWLTLLPWGIRNYLVIDRFVFTNTSSGVNFFLGTQKTPRLSRSKEFKMPDPNAKLICSSEYPSALDEISRGKFLKRKAFEMILNDPAEYLLRKAKLFLKETFYPSLSGNYYDIFRAPGHESAKFIPEIGPIIEVIASLFFVLGFILIISRRHIGAMILIGFLFFGNALSTIAGEKLRFFLPFLPIFFIVAVYGLESGMKICWRKWGEKRGH